MQLKNNLYTILSANREEQSFTLALQKECFIYRAHFPELPITPGVCIIGVANELLEELLSSKLELDVVSNAKFLAVVNPLETPEITYYFKKIVKDEKDGRVKVQVIVSHEDQIFSKLSLGYKWDTKRGKI